MATQWFEVDKKGLAQILEKRGKEFILFELLQNGLDENVTEVIVTMLPVPGEPKVNIRVDDDSPDGWKSLRDAWTLFAPSYKKGDVTKRGRFNLGEKLVLAFCDRATISTTTGTVMFGPDGRKTSKRKREVGSAFEATVRMTREEAEQVKERVTMLLPPKQVLVLFNNEEIPYRHPIQTDTAVLPTEIADEEGNLRRTNRKTDILIYETRGREKAHIFEMGIPVVPIDCPFHVNVQQKVPLNMDRDNVTASYLRKLLAIVLNKTHDLLNEGDVTQPWAQQAAGSQDVEPEALKAVLDKQFGEKRVMFDPSDQEANKIATAQGFTVVSGRSLPLNVRANIRSFRAIGEDVLPPAGQVTPSPKAYGESGDIAKDVHPTDRTDAMERVMAYTKVWLEALLDKPVRVRLMRVRNFTGAWCARRTPEFHFGFERLGRRWFDMALIDPSNLDSLILHEVAHDFSGDHLSSAYHEALCDLGAKMKRLTVKNSLPLRP